MSETVLDAPVKPAPERRFRRALLRSPKGMTGLAMIGVIVLCAMFAPLLAPHDHSQ